MSYFDIALVVIVAAFALNGFAKGLIQLLGRIVGLIVGAFIASHYYLAFYDWAGKFVNWNEGTEKVLSFIILFVIVTSLAGLLFGFIEKIYDLLSVVPFTKLINRLLGAALGLLEGSLAIGLILYVAVRYAGAGIFFANQIAHSQVVPWLLKAVNLIVPILPSALKGLQAVVK